jgi:hypothetical protein
VLGLSAVSAVVLLVSANLDERLSLVTSSGHCSLASPPSSSSAPCIAAVAAFCGELRFTLSYRESWNCDRAVRQIEQDAGTHFGSRCVGSFRVVCRRIGTRLRGGGCDARDR